jgi:hypothetical protein
MQLTIWLKDAKIFLGGDPSKGQTPIVTVDAKNPQVMIDQDKGTITIVETK